MARNKSNFPPPPDKDPRLLAGSALFSIEMFKSLLDLLGLDEKYARNPREAIPLEAWKGIDKNKIATASKVSLDWFFYAINRNNVLPWGLEGDGRAVFRQGARNFIEPNRAKMNEQHRTGKERGPLGKGHQHPRAKGNQNARKYPQTLAPYYTDPREETDRAKKIRREEARKANDVEACRPWEERTASFVRAFANWTGTETQLEKFALTSQEFQAVTALHFIEWQEEILHVAGQWSGTPAGQEAIKSATATNPIQLQPLVERFIEGIDGEALDLPAIYY